MQVAVRAQNKADMCMDREVIKPVRKLHEEKLQAVLEPDRKGRVVAVEPNTEHLFLGSIVAEALASTHPSLPESRLYVRRIGYDFVHSLRGRLLGHR